MSNLNDNNLDDLLRRAAEKYPLRTDTADFAKLVADLEKDPSLILPPLNSEDRRRRRRFFWLFLFLPLAGGAYYAWHTTSGRAHQTEVAQGQQVAAPKATAGTEEKNGPEADEAKTKGANSGGMVVKTDAETKGKNGKAKPGNSVATDTKATGESEEGSVAGTTRVKGQRTNTVTPGKSEKATDPRTAGKRGQGTGVRTAVESGEATGAKATREREKGTYVTTIGERGHNRNGKPAFEQTADNGIAPANDNVAIRLDAAPTRTAGGKVSLAATKGAVAVNILVRSNTVEPVKNSAPAKDKIKLQKPKPSFYVGILGSPDISAIRFQSVKSVGSNFGLLLGYSFNSRWAVETGLYYDRKKYYTNGEYFSKSKVPRLNDIDLKTVDGVCNMWEIPVNVRYNFSTGGSMKWFATAGLSTYLMSKESYTFTGTYGTNPNWHQTWPYKTPYKYWFSILNLSVGYEQRLGKIGNLRLEPFLRVPLSGIGTGSLSIMSAGLNIGITRRIW